MDALRTGDGFSDEEIAYLKSGGADPLPPSDPEPAPAAEDEGAPQEPAVDDASQDDPEVIEADAHEEDANKGRKVKYAAYLRQKSEADAARKEREEYRTKFEASERERAVQNARIEERFKQWQAAQSQASQQQAPQQAPPPDRNEDPLAYMAWQDERLNRLEQYTNQSAQQRHQSNQIAQLDNAYRSDNHQAAREMPEYPEAYNYVLQRAQRIVQAQNPRFSPAQVNQAVEMQERQLAAVAMQQNRRPAAMIMEMAQIYGWSPKGQDAAQAAPQSNAEAEQAKLDAVARGQTQNRTLSGSGRPGGNTATMTLERFTNLSDDEAREWAEKNPGGLARISGQ